MKKWIKSVSLTEMKSMTGTKEFYGTVINIPAEVKHWHGAAVDSWFSHLALEIPGEDGSTEWCEAVSNEEYEKLK